GWHGVYGRAEHVVGTSRLSPTVNIAAVVPRVSELRVFAFSPDDRPVPAASSWEIRFQRRGATSWADMPASEFRLRVDEARRHASYRGLLPGTYRALVRVPGFGVGVSEVVEVVDARMKDADVKLLAGRQVTGRVVDEEGHAIARAWASFSPDAPAARRSPTDTEGRFQLGDVPRDDTSFFVAAPGYESREVPFMHGEASVEDVVLARPPGERP
ncbi:MAG: carboxypeptidase-like regulatory domain-containing protein, partial [Planctomycetota bacterium]